MNRVAELLWVTLMLGGTFTALFILSFIEYFWGDGDGARLGFCAAFAVFALPLFIGSLLLVCRRKAGLRFLRFGSVSFLIARQHLVWRQIQELELDTDYAVYMYKVVGRAKSDETSQAPASSNPTSSDIQKENAVEQEH